MNQYCLKYQILPSFNLSESDIYIYEFLDGLKVE